MLLMLCIEHYSTEFRHLALLVDDGDEPGMQRVDVEVHTCRDLFSDT